MRFQPKSEKEITEMNLWPAGEYGFEIIDNATLGKNAYSTVDRQSKNGNDMIQLVVKVYNADGQFRIIIDYLLEAMPAKLRHAAMSCGLVNEYESGTLEAINFIGKTGYLKLKIDKDKTGQYADKNGIADYVVSEVDTGAVYAPPKSAPANSAAIADDDIPFMRYQAFIWA